MNFTTQQYIREEVEKQLSNKLNPTFFDFIIQEMRFKHAIDDSIQKYLPDVVVRKLRDSDSIVAHHINIQLPALVAPCVDSYIKELKQQFTQQIYDQQKQFDKLHTQHLSSLTSSSRSLIEKHVKEVSSNTAVIEKMKSMLK